MTNKNCIKLGEEYEDAIWNSKSAWDNAAWISSYYYLIAEDYKKVRWLWELLRDGDPAIGRAEEKHIQTAKALTENFQNPKEFHQMRELILTNVRKIFFEVRAENPKDLIAFDSAIKKGTKKIKKQIEEQKTGLDSKKTELVIDYVTIRPGLLLSAIEILEKK